MFPSMWTHFDFAPTIEFDFVWEVLQPLVFANFQPVHEPNLSRLASHASGKQSRRSTFQPNPTFATRGENHKFFEAATASCLGIRRVLSEISVWCRPTLFPSTAARC